MGDGSFALNGEKQHRQGMEQIVTGRLASAWIDECLEQYACQ
jgi:hypothetical protein